MFGGDFLARIKLAIEGREKVVSDLKTISKAGKTMSAQLEAGAASLKKQWNLASGAAQAERGTPTKTKITSIFDAQGLKTGQQIEETFAGINKQTVKGAKGMGDFERAMRRAVIVAPVWMALRTAMQSVMALINDQVKFLRELEDAMARIKIVGKGTTEEFNNLKESLVSMSLIYGTVASTALKAAVIFAQQGKSVDEVIKLTRVAMIGAQVLGADVVTTVDNMTAAIEAFNIPINDTINIINKWINVEKQFAVTAKDLADATKATGATANQMGISIDSFLGDVTAVIEVTRKSGSEAARGLSFIYARLLTTGQQALETIGKVPVHLDAQGKATFAMTNQYRSVSDILDDVSGKWETYTNKEKLAIATSIASKRQLTVFMALMQNYDAAIKARIASIASAGQAESALAIIQDTLSFKLNQSQAAWNALASSIGDTSVFKGAIDSVTELVEGWAAFVDIQKAYTREAQKVIDKNKKQTDTEASSAQSLKELIELRDKYLTKVPSDRNQDILKNIEQAITDVNGKPLDVGIDSKKMIANLDAKIDMLRKQAIREEINIKLETDKKILDKDIADMKDKLRFKPNEGFGMYFQKGLANLVGYGEAARKINATVEKRKNLEKESAKTISAALSKYETEKVFGQDAIDRKKIELDMNPELLQTEQDKIAAQSRLNEAKQSGVLTNQQMLDLEIKLFDAMDKSENVHERAVKLAELEAKRREAIINDTKKQTGLLSSILNYSGEQESTIIKQEMAIKAMTYNEKYINNSMEDRLKLAQALTKEAEEQNKKSSHAVELAKILRKYGPQTAQEIADYQGGAKAFDELSATAKEALKKFVPSSYEQEQATQDITRAGIVTPEAIQKEVTQQRNMQILNQVMIDPIELNVSLDSDAVIQAAKDAIVKELDDLKSPLSKKFDNKIERH